MIKNMVIQFLETAGPTYSVLAKGFLDGPNYFYLIKDYNTGIHLLLEVNTNQAFSLETAKHLIASGWLRVVSAKFFSGFNEEVND